MDEPQSDEERNERTDLSETDAGETDGRRSGLTRGEALGAGAATLAGLGLGGAFRATSVASAAVPIVPTGNIMLLPSATAAAYFQRNLLKERAFLPFYDRLATEFNFIPKRALLAVGIPEGEVSFLRAPYVLAIVPGVSLKSNIKASSHEVASIVFLRQGDLTVATASRVVVSHRPYQVTSFSLLEYDEEGAFNQLTLSRTELASASPSALAKKLGAPRFPPESVALDGPTGADAAALLSIAYQILLTDKWAKKFYPVGATKSLAREASLVQKWSRVCARRYLLFTPATGGPLARIGSTSSSSYGCTSTSSCWGGKDKSAA